MVEVYAYRFHEKLNHSQYEHLISLIAVDRQERIKRYHRLDDAERSLIADVLIRFILCSKYKLDNRKLMFGANKYGKPFLKEVENLHFNVSHSGEWVVCAINHLPIGIDIELIQPIDMNIAKRFFSLDEYYELMRYDDAQRLSYFYDLWTLKESYIKAEGKGLSIPLDSFSIMINSDIKLKTDINSSDYYFKRYDIDKKYKMAVCAKEYTFNNSVVFVSINDLLAIKP